MFQPTNPQISLLECQFLLPSDKLARLQRSWAEAFQKRILPLIDEEVLRDAFSEDSGRPNKSIRLLVGLHLLKEWNDLTDEQVLDSFEFNLQWHYALAVEPSTAHVCQKTLHNFRVKLMDSDRGQRMFEQVTSALAEADGLGLGRQRLDSTHVLSNIAVLTRLGLFVETVTHFLRELKRCAPDKLSQLHSGYSKRYLERDGYFADAKREQARRRLPVVATDVCRLVAAFDGDEAVGELESYRLLVRLFTEQCEIIGADEAASPLEAVEAPVEGVAPAAVEPHDQVEEPQPKPASDKGSEEGDEAGGGGDKEGGEPCANAGAPGRMDREAMDTAQTEPPDVGCEGVKAGDVERDAGLADEGPVATLKDPRSISSDSLQSPHDPDATYGHKGKGYEVQLSETCGEDNPYQIITAVVVNGAHESDQGAVIPLLEQLEACDMKPQEMSADTGYGSGKNIVACAELGVDLQAPVQDPHAPKPADPWEQPAESMRSTASGAEPPSVEEDDRAAHSGPETGVALEDFSFNSTFDRVQSCPQGHSPIEQHLDKAGDNGWATFSSEGCAGCPWSENCPTRAKASGDRTLRWNRATAATARRQVDQRTKTFKERYKIRSGIESTNAEFKGRHGADDIRVRGRGRLTLAMQLKALAVNVKRAVQYHVAQLVATDPEATLAAQAAPC